MKQYVGIVRDHSASMASLSGSAMKDYNSTVAAVKKAAQENSLSTIASVVSFIHGETNLEINNKGIDSLQSINNYRTGGGTPLFDAVDELIELFKNVPDANSKNVSFLIMAVTDGEENESSIDHQEFESKLRRLQGTDRWTFVFRVPRGYGRQLERLGVPSGNIQEWDQTERGFQESSTITASAVGNYFKGMRSGLGATRSFYANMAGVSPAKVASKMKDISDDVTIYPVKDRTHIETFALHKLGQYDKGQWHYQLSKPESRVQDYKSIVVRNKNTGAVFGGGDARKLLGIPDSGTIRLKPGNHGDWDIFIQSTSHNRVLTPNTSVLRWEK